MTDLCLDLARRLAAHEWFHDHESFVAWLDGTVGVETCIAAGLSSTSEACSWGLFEGYVHAASLRPDRAYTGPLCSVLAQHDLDVNYEDIVDALGELRDPASIDCLAATLVWEPDWDEYRGLAVKCVWALAAIGTPEAWAVLEAAAVSGPDVVRETIYAERS